MLTLFRTNQLIANTLLILYALLLRFSVFLPEKYSGAAWTPPNSGVLSEWIYASIGTNSLAANLMALFLVFFQAVLINIMMSKHRVANEITLFPGLFYIFVVSCLPEFLHLSPLLMANTFYILALVELFDTYKKHSAAGKIYNIGLSAGIGSLFYFSYLIFFLFGFIALSILRAFKLRERIMLLFGLASTFLLSGVYSFWTNQWNWFWQHQFADNMAFLDFNISFNWLTYVKIGFVTLLFFVCIFSYNSYVAKKNMQKQKYINILYWGLILSLSTLFFQSDVQIEHLLILSTPLSILLSFNFLNMKKPSAESIHLLLVFAVIILQFNALWIK